MALRPEDVKQWALDDSLVADKLQAIGELVNGRALTDTYQRLKAMLKTYPPNPKAFSEPKIVYGRGYFWVRSENKQVTIRAKYFAAQEICIIDKLFLANETPRELNPEKEEA